MNAERNLLMAVDPGNVESAYVIIDADTLRPVLFGKLSNLLVRSVIASHPWCRPVYVEMIAHYGTGMPAGSTVFDTCLAIGRIQQLLDPDETGGAVELVYRRDVKLHHCGSSKAKDANVTQALIDRFAPGAGNHGKGTKAAPGWFYGFKADIWAAYAIAVYVADVRLERAVLTAARQQEGTA